MQQEVVLQCPHCFEIVSMWLAIDDVGEQYCDCSVCCHPWQLFIWINDEGRLCATVQAAY